MQPGGAGQPGVGAACTKTPFSSRPTPPRLPLGIFHEGFPAQLWPLLPAKPLCAPSSWLASASITASSL